MVSLLTQNSPKYAAMADECKLIGDAAANLSAILTRLVDEDANSFDRVSAAYRLPKASADQKTSRSAAIQTALLGAIAPPVEVISRSREVCALAAQLADIGNTNALSDVGCAALCAAAAGRCAALNVEINAGALKDRAVAQRYLSQSEANVAEVTLLSEVVLGKLRATAGA